MLILERFARESGRDYALRTLKENIIRAELEPGAYISENELAAQLGLSRTPVREALIELSRCKAVEISPQKRSQVAYIDEALVEEARFARKVLEPAVAAQVCATATEEDLLRLDENVKLQEFFRSSGQLTPSWPWTIPSTKCCLTSPKSPSSTTWCETLPSISTGCAAWR